VNCQEVRELLVLEADGALELDEQEILSGHLAGCPACQAERLRTATDWRSVRLIGQQFKSPETSRISALVTVDPGLVHRANGHVIHGANGHAPQNGHSNGSARSSNGHARSLVRPAAVPSAGPKGPAHLRARPRGRRVLAGLIAAAVLLGGVYAASQLAQRGPSSSLQPLLVRLGDQGVIRDADGVELTSGSAVKTGRPMLVTSAAASTVRFASGSEVQLAGDGEVVVHADELEVLSGAFRLSMAGGAVVRIPGATIKPVEEGVEVAVSYRRGPAARGGNATGEVTVLRGRVSVLPGNGTEPVDLGSGGRYPLPEGDVRAGDRQHHDGDQDVNGSGPSDHGLRNSDQRPTPSSTTSAMASSRTSAFAHW
jgi:hypothetical protein